ncbi:MAG TPA: divalent-cation tolerance protein CutA [Pyrinomonadaceae bacterium]|jgi:periplasmic divalent cation tolerance protein
MLIVLTTTPNAEEGEGLARKILEARLAACVQVLPPMKSFYVWEGEIQTDSEHLLLVKTQAGKFDELKGFIEANHSYEVPEIVGVEAEKVSDGYLKWLDEAVVGGR